MIQEPWQHAFAQVNGIRLHYVTQGEGKLVVEAMVKPGVLTAALNYYRAAFREFARRGERPVAKIRCPTLLIWAEEDRALGKELTSNTEAYCTGRCALQYIPRCGHWVQQEQPELVNQYMPGVSRRSHCCVACCKEEQDHNGAT